jgi:hydrogenase maturation protein HypF
MNDIARRFLVQGQVQGCGLRPALARLALANDWTGNVRNTPDGVVFVIQGKLPPDAELNALIAQVIPESARIVESTSEPIREATSRDVTNHGFQIVESTTSGPLSVPLPRDSAICAECLQETRDPVNRRYRYPFATCAHCGPRYSLLISMPFDRVRTTMHPFRMCPECEREYHDPRDRRFHAQTISCPGCGPVLWTNDSDGSSQRHGLEALCAAADMLCRGRIVAMRGIGGYQLLADATSSEAARRMRQNKRRTAKPFAVLCRTLADAHRIAELNAEEERQLTSASNPIVLVRQQPTTGLAPEINPGLSDIGLMLPTTALHDVLLGFVGVPLVCTSGNADGEPLAYQVDDAEHKLRSIADLILHHDREIHRPIDDSVVRVIANRPVTIRTARGIAPLPLLLSDCPPDSTTKDRLIACGGHQKSAIAIFNGVQSFLAPHVGDLDTLAAQDRWDSLITQLNHLVADPGGGDCPADFVCDAHSAYYSTQWASSKSCSLQVWHHHAHVVAGMLEHQWLDREVLGVAWDGTGLGPDGTIWGGEFLRSTSTQFCRVAHFRPFVLPGGEAAIVDLRRIGISMLSQLDELSAIELSGLIGMNSRDVDRIQQSMASAYSPTTTSCGRLFDAAAFLILDQTHTEFEGHAAICLEAACDRFATGAYQFAIQATDPLQIDWRPVLRQIIADRRVKTPQGVMAMKFHRGLAQVIIDIAHQFPELSVVLAGGVFQNRILVELVEAEWPVNGQEMGLPGAIPPNDGGLAAGQLAVAMASRSTEVQRMFKETSDVSGSSRPTCPMD